MAVHCEVLLALHGTPLLAEILEAHMSEILHMVLGRLVDIYGDGDGGNERMESSCGELCCLCHALITTEEAQQLVWQRDGHKPLIKLSERREQPPRIAHAALGCLERLAALRRANLDPESLSLQDRGVHMNAQSDIVECSVDALIGAIQCPELASAAAYAVAAAVYDNETTQTLMIKGGVVGALINIVGGHAAEPGALDRRAGGPADLLAALDALEALLDECQMGRDRCVSPQPADVAISEPDAQLVISTLTSFLQGNPPPLQAAVAARVLGSLAIVGKFAEAISSAGAVPLLVHLLQSSATAPSSAALALSWISNSADAARRTCAHGGIPHLMRLVTSKDESTAEFAQLALEQLAKYAVVRHHLRMAWAGQADVKVPTSGALYKVVGPLFDPPQHRGPTEADATDI